MSTFLSLTNELLRRINEVEMDETSFMAARNIQALAKDAINASVREVLNSGQEWPFLLTTSTQTTTVGVSEYAFPASTSSVDWESFYLRQRVDQTNRPAKLDAIPYVEYLRKHRASDESGGEAARDVPVNVYMTQEDKFGLTPTPDKEYVIEFKRWTFPSDLYLASDICVIPERFKSVVIDGGMMFIMTFRSNEQSAMMHKTKLEDGIKSMRRILIDDAVSMTSSMIVRPHTSSRVKNG